MKDKYAVYNGVKYEATSKGNEIILIVHEITEGFVTSIVRKNYFTKNVQKSEVSEYYSLRKMAIYKDVEVAILDENENEVLLYGSHHRLPSIGFETTDRGEYRKWVAKSSLDKVVEERIDYIS